jgi:hypothetical protein
MRKLSPCLLGLYLAAACFSPAPAPAQSTTTAPDSKYTQVTVEYTKPGKGGLAHDKTEGAFVQAMTKAKFPIHYIAYNSLSGKARAIYMSDFNSFAELEKANKIFDSPTVAAEFERLNVADGELLEDTKQLILSSVPDLSFHSKADITHDHYLEARIVSVRPGHGKEFEDLVKMWIALGEKAGSSDHWGAYRVEYGDQVGSYVFFTSDTSMADIDKSYAEEPKYKAVVTDEDRKKMRELRAAAIESDRFELYSVNPAQSYPSEEFIKADPTYWKPKPAAAAKPAAKPAADDKKAAK